MKVALIFFIAAIVEGYIISNKFNVRIVNGEYVEPGEIPYQVSLQYIFGFQHFCGGAILNKYYVITAAHCMITEKPESIRVVAGSIDLNDPKSIYAVKKIIIHEKYDNHKLYDNDIALIKVQTEFKVSSLLNFIAIPITNHQNFSQSIATVSGWGSVFEGGPSSNMLQKTEHVLVSQEYCKMIYDIHGFTIGNTSICTINAIEETGACHGDSGGPLTVNGVLVGLVSGGKKCGSTMYPSIYTRVSEYIDWIKDNTL